MSRNVLTVTTGTHSPQGVRTRRAWVSPFLEQARHNVRSALAGEAWPGFVAPSFGRRGSAKKKLGLKKKRLVFLFFPGHRRWQRHFTFAVLIIKINGYKPFRGVREKKRERKRVKGRRGEEGKGRGVRVGASEGVWVCRGGGERYKRRNFGVFRRFGGVLGVGWSSCRAGEEIWH